MSLIGFLLSRGVPGQAMDLNPMIAGRAQHGIMVSNKYAERVVDDLAMATVVWPEIAQSFRVDPGTMVALKEKISWLKRIWKEK